jgi:hypothetical protein
LVVCALLLNGAVVTNRTADCGTENGMVVREVTSRGPDSGARQTSRLRARSEVKSEH